MSQKYLPRENPELYEINTAAWLFELSQKLGRKVLLADVPSEEWDKLKALGMDFVWLMGAWSRSQEGRKIGLNSPKFRALIETILPACSADDIIGSCYSISGYRPDPLIGTWEDLDRAREELHRRGMGLILDFVPNHTGIDHNWLGEHPEYFIQGSEGDYQKDREAFFPILYEGKTLYIAHGRDPNFPPWSDTAQLNYFNPETRYIMIQTVKEISNHCDGVRCDMAMLVLNDIFQRIWGWTDKNGAYPRPAEEFWNQVFRQVPDLVYIAEAYWDTEWTLQQMGFDFTYDKRLYDRMRSAHPHDVYLHLTADITYQRKLVRFIENHDELRSIPAFGRSKVKAVATLFSTLPGMKLYFHGQMEGKQIHVPIQVRRSKPEAKDPEIEAFYSILLPEINEPIYHNGTWHLKEVFPEGDRTAENLIACVWKLGDSLRLVVVNLNQNPAQGRVFLSDSVSELYDYSITEILSGNSFNQSGKMIAHPGFALKLAGYQAQIFRISPVL